MVTEVQGFDYPANIQFEEKDDLLVQKNEPSFFKRIDTIRAREMGFYVMTGVGFLTIGFSAGISDNRIRIGSVGLGIGIIIAGVLLVSGSFYRKSVITNTTLLVPEDSKCRAKYSEVWGKLKEISGKEPTIEHLIGYVDVVGAENIEKWGLRLHPDSHPFITKNKMRDFIMSEKSNPILFKLFETCKTRLKEEIKLIDLVKKYEILSQEDKKIIEKRLVHFIPIYQGMGTLDSFVDDLTTYGFNTTPEMQQAISKESK